VGGAIADETILERVSVVEAFAEDSFLPSGSKADL
jgi:hypothetical protein